MLVRYFTKVQAVSASLLSPETSTGSVKLTALLVSFQGPGAYWVLIDPTGPHLRRTNYDTWKAAEIVRATNYPQAEEFAKRNILEPPSEASMLDAFSRIELK